jgi:hypothetical protein
MGASPASTTVRLIRLSTADVARPVVIHQQPHRVRRQLDVRLVVLGNEYFFSEGPPSTLKPLVQRRHVDADDVEAEEEVFAN